MKEEMNKEEQISIVPLRELSYEDAKREIVAYSQQAGNRKVYISEIAEKLWYIISDALKIEDKEFKATDNIEESTIYIYSPGRINWTLQPDMIERLEKARKLNKKIVRFDILDIDKMPDKTISKIKITEE